MRKLAVLVFLMFGGCSTAGHLERTGGSAAPLSHDASFDVVITKSSGVRAAAISLGTVRKEVVSALISNHIFKEEDSEKPAYRVEILVTEMYDNKGASDLRGLLIGRNHVSGDVKVNDSTGRLIQSLRVGGKGASHPLAAKNGFEYAAKEFAKRLAEGLR